MSSSLVVSTGSPGYEVNPDAVTTLNSQIDDYLAGSGISRTSTFAGAGSMTIVLSEVPAPEQAAHIYYLINVNDPYREPLPVTMYTYAGVNTVRADVSDGAGGSSPKIYYGSRDNEIHIATDGQADFSSIGAALAAVTDDNVVFIVHPGTYTEQNPLPVRTGCSLVSDGNFENTYIVAANIAQPLVSLGPKTLVKGLTFQGAKASAGIYFDASASGGAGTVSSVQECAFKDCLIAIEADGKDGGGIPDTLFCEKVKITPLSQNLQYGLYAHNRGQIISNVLSVLGVPGYFGIGKGVYAVGSGTKVTIISSSIWFVDRAMVVDAGAELEVVLVTSSYNNVGVEVGSSGTTSHLSASELFIKNSIIYDINVLANNAVIEIHTGAFSDVKINNPNAVKLNAFYHLIRYGRYYQSMTGTVLLGSSREPSELYAGEGHYDIDRSYILSNDNGESGSWVDNTDGALSEDAPPFYLFQGTAAGNCAYIGRQTNVVGVVVEVIAACAGAAKGDIVYEYWNGSTWVEFKVHESEYEAPYYTSDASFLAKAEKQQLRFGVTTATPMAQRTINGKTAKWARIRVVNALASIPQCEMMKPHPNSTEIDSDGSIKHFGDSRMVQKLHMEYVAGSAAPGDQTLYTGANLAVALKANSFPAGVRSAAGYAVVLGRNLDNSFPLKMSIGFMGTSSTAGNVRWRIRYCNTDNGESVYSAAPGGASAGELIVDSDVAVSAADVAKTAEIKFDVSNMNVNMSGANQCVLWLSIERAGDEDSYDGAVNVYELALWGVKWASGTHILAY